MTYYMMFIKTFFSSSFVFLFSSHYNFFLDLPETRENLAKSLKEVYFCRIIRIHIKLYQYQYLPNPLPPLWLPT